MSRSTRLRLPSSALELLTQGLPESDVQDSALTILSLHPLIQWCLRLNTGVANMGTPHSPRFVRFSSPGMSDIIGQTTSGLFVAIECKTKGEVPTDDQWEFLCNVANGRGISGWINDPSQVTQLLSSRPGTLWLPPWPRNGSGKPEALRSARKIRSYEPIRP